MTKPSKTTQASKTTRAPKAPKTHANTITETVELSNGLTRTYSAKLREYALWSNGEMIATVHAVSIAWSLVIGCADTARATNTGRRFAGTHLNLNDALNALDALGN